MAISIIPQESDYNWFSGAPDVSGTSNTLMVGAYDPTLYQESDTNQTLTLTSSAPNIWQFDLNASFGYVNMTDPDNITEYYTNITNWQVGYSSTLLQTTYPGLGLWRTPWTIFVAQLQAYSGYIWDCTAKDGGYCSAPVWCNQFNGESYASYNFTDINFKFHFTNSTDPNMYVKVPLMALMRNGDSSGNPRCDILVYRTSQTNQYTRWILMGEAIIQQFFVELTYNGNGVATNNTMTLSKTPYTLEGAVITNVVYENSTPDVPNTNGTDSNSTAADDDIVVVPETKIARFSTLQKVQIMGAILIACLLCLLCVCLALVFCKHKNDVSEVYGKNADAEDVIYQVDRNTLMKEAREKVYY
jgi:hypothetical protein